jgi:hypothetical protein
MALLTCKLYDSLLDYLLVLFFIWFCVHSHVCGIVTMEDLREKAHVCFGFVLKEKGAIM